MKDINGDELVKGAAALLLCEILSIEQHQVVVRIMNSDTELAVGTKHDEVLGGLVADSELTAFHDETSAGIKCPTCGGDKDSRLYVANPGGYCLDPFHGDHANDDQADGVKTCRME